MQFSVWLYTWKTVNIPKIKKKYLKYFLSALIAFFHGKMFAYSETTTVWDKRRPLEL